MDKIDLSSIVEGIMSNEWELDGIRESVPGEWYYKLETGQILRCGDGLQSVKVIVKRKNPMQIIVEEIPGWKSSSNYLYDTIYKSDSLEIRGFLGRWKIREEK